jgi:hypothetical protein
MAGFQFFIRFFCRMRSRSSYTGSILKQHFNISIIWINIGKHNHSDDHKRNKTVWYSLTDNSSTSCYFTMTTGMISTQTNTYIIHKRWFTYSIVLTCHIRTIIYFSFTMITFPTWFAWTRKCCIWCFITCAYEEKEKIWFSFVIIKKKKKE